MNVGIVYLGSYNGLDEGMFCDSGTVVAMRVECRGHYELIRKSVGLVYEACDGVVVVYSSSTWHFLQKTMLMEFGRSGIYSSVAGKPMVLAAGFVHKGGGTFVGEVNGKPFLFIDGDSREPNLSPVSSVMKGSFACVGVFGEDLSDVDGASVDEVGSWVVCPVSRISAIPVRNKDNIYTVKGESEARVLFELLKGVGGTLSTAESCTGGMIAKTITDIPGSSEVFVGGFVTYSNSLKERTLGVYPEDLRRYGAVSEDVARQMVVGALQRSGSDYAVCTTGIAGPGGGTESKPVGLVYVGAASRREVIVRRREFSGNRFVVRNKSTRYAFLLLRSLVLGVI